MGIPCISINAQSAESPHALLAGYIEAVKNSDWETAERCWHPDEIQKSMRLGIEYENIPAKFDCSSPLITLHMEIIDGRVSVELGESDIRDEFSSTNLLFLAGGDTLSVTYYAVMDDDRWYLVPPMTALASEWKSRKSRFTNIIYSDESLINDYAIAALDDYIADLLVYFETDSVKIHRLRQSKINYYLCTENDFRDLTGYNAHGLAYLAMDAIITRHLPHPHELTHLLINYTLDSVPLYTLPFIQEGLACACGGRWGKSPDVINQLGCAILDNGVCGLDDILTLQGFNIDVGMPDITYPVSSLFTEYLIEKIGMDKFKRLYRELSGSSGDVGSFTIEQVKATIEDYFGYGFDSLRSDFMDFIGRHNSSGIVVPEGNRTSEVIRTIESQGMEIKISDSPEYLDFLIGGIGIDNSGVLLFEDKSNSLPDMYRSWMYAEHLPGQKYNGACYGIRFDTAEVGFYDYGTNILKAKFVSSFTPAVKYFDPENKTIEFSLKKSLLPKSIEDYIITLDN